MDSVLLELSQEAFEGLVEEVPGVAANLARTLGFRLRRETTGHRPRSMPRVIGLVNYSHDTCRLTPLVAKALADRNDPIRVLSECPVEVDHRSVKVETIPSNPPKSDLEWLRDQIAPQTDSQGHTLVGVQGDVPSSKLSAVLTQCEQVWWIVDPKRASRATERLQSILKSDPDLASRIHWVWMLDAETTPNAIPTTPEGISSQTFKVVLSSPRSEKQSLSRLVRHVRGTRLGLALGGGAARGLAHLGVLRALEEADIYVDVIAGTSAGALMALPYCYGWDVGYIAETFKRDLTPSWAFRQLPKSNQWFMLYKYRTFGWERMLRNHFGEVRLDQLLIPLSTVAADLIAGKEVVRDSSDAVNGVLESINLPSIARPILRDGMALVDGGIINNVPTDLLAERGADLVIGVDIARRLARQFAKNTPGMGAEAMRNAGQFETIMRANEVQDHMITNLRTAEVDFMISVDTSEFEFADFTKAHELAAAGEEATKEGLPQLRQLLDEQEQSEAMTSSSRFTCPVPRRIFK